MMEGEYGYCANCAFEVPANKVGRKLILVTHARSVGSGSAVQGCGGSGTEATLQPGPEAKPKALWYSPDLEDEDDDDADMDATGGD
jgi:hypothetical protein